jgi:hypothetical protein
VDESSHLRCGVRHRIKSVTRWGRIATVSALGALPAEAYDRLVNREDARGEFRPVDVLRTLYLLAKLAVFGVALLVLLVALWLVPRARRRAAFA